MNNGQCTIASVGNVAPVAAQEPAVTVAVTTDGEQQNSGGFAGLLSGVQDSAKDKAAPLSSQKEHLQNKTGTDQPSSDTGTVNSAADLLALLSNGSQQVAAALASAAPTPEDPKKTGACADSKPLHGETSGMAAQMAMAAYSQPVGIPNVAVPPLITGDSRQNAPTGSLSPDAVSAPLVGNQTVLVAAAALQATPVQATPLQATPVQPDRMSGINTPVPLPVDGLRSTTAATDQPALFSATTDKIQVEQKASEPVQAKNQVQIPVTLSAEAASALTSDERIAPQGVKTAEVTVMPAEKPAAAIGVLQPGMPAAHVTPELQIAKDQTGNEQNGAKEMASSVQATVSSRESTLGSGTSSGSDSNRKEPDVASDRQLLEQQMLGQLKTAHQSVTALSAKSVSTDSVRQDIPEQVMQQLKDRLVQHDVKPGNQQITLTLSPDSLGEIKVNLALQGQKLSVTISTENQTVRDAIAQHTGALKESLARQNITMESFDVTSGGKDSGNQGQNQNAWRELANQQQQQSWTTPRGYTIAQADLPSGQAAHQRQQGQTMLDIHY